jgi:hypothetical protein
MGFFNALRRVLSPTTHEHLPEETKQRIRDAWGLDDEDVANESAEGGSSPASAYDRSQWQKRLKRILDELPDSQSEWVDLMGDANALELEPSWIKDRQREEFSFLIRRAVSDRVVTEEEHHKLDLARSLIGISEVEAEESLHAIMAEAESFFGAPVQDET